MNNKKFASIIVTLFISFSSFSQDKLGIKFTETSWTKAVKQAKAENKLIFMDAYTSWCGPCKMLQKQVFPNKELGEYFNKNFVNVAYDMEEGEGVQLANLFRVQAYPTLFFIDPNTGKVIKQVLGFQDVSQLMKVGQTAVAKKKS